MSCDIPPKVLHMAHVCPWWFAYSFDNPLRRFIHNPERIFAPFLRKGMTAADIGCGLGYFSLGMARMVGETGRVVAVDIQPQMLAGLRRRAKKSGLSRIIATRLCTDREINVGESLDFALAFWMVHETPDPSLLFSQLANALKQEGRLLITEPVFHVTAREFARTIAQAVQAGFRVEGDPSVRFSHSAVLLKAGGGSPSM